MEFIRHQLCVKTSGQKMYEITDQIQRLIIANKINEGIAHIHCKHTSCSLILMENADPSARHDLEAWLDRLVPQRDPLFTHTYEGPDDMPSHIKMALTRTQETLPISNERLDLGTWQGLYLWEHRNYTHHRDLVITLIGMKR